jgi:outer membrane protein OmpA-like peptidoglycan-associated protein
MSIVRTKAETSGEVQVDAKAIENSLAANGRIALYGIHFDTASAVIKPDSANTLAQMAQALSQQPQLKVYIVGHTDDQGSFNSNRTLSTQRAEAVVAALIGQYHIAASRLQADGIGPLSPVGSNRTEAGRSGNRRVEMVERVGG